MNTTKYRMIGTTDDVTTCANCGKPELRGTVILEFVDADGNSEGVTYFGTTCAARALAARGVRITAAKVRDQARFAQAEREQRAAYATQSLTTYGVPVDGDYDIFAAANIFVSRNTVCVQNNPSMDILSKTRELIDTWRAQVAA